jgi:hypothetical protein
LKQGFSTGKEKFGTVDLRVEAYPLEMQMISAETQSSARGVFSLSNPSTEPMTLQSDGEITGYERMHDSVIENSDLYTYKFKKREGEDAIRFDFMLSREDYNLFTDITLQIIRDDSSALANTAFDLRNKSVSMGFGDNDTNTYTLIFRGGLALPDRDNKFRILAKERRILANQYGVRVEPALSTLNPAEARTYSFESSRQLGTLPPGYRWSGVFRLKQGNDSIRLPWQF